MKLEIAKSDEIISILEECNPEAIMYEGFNDALVGMIARAGTEPLALYDRNKILNILIGHGLSSEIVTGESAEAEVFFGTHVGGDVPVDSADIGSDLVDVAPEAGGPVGSSDGDEVSAGAVVVDGDIEPKV